MAEYIIGGTLSHALGRTWANHKYIDKIPVGGGKYQYIYASDKARKNSGVSPAAQQRAASTRVSVMKPQPKYGTTSASLRSRYAQEASLSSRTKGNTSSSAKSMYAKTYGGNLSKVGSTALKADQKVSSVRAQANATKDWAKRQMDWASGQVSKGLSSVRDFISGILGKIGATSKTISRWADSQFKQFGKTDAGKALEPYLRNVTGRATPVDEVHRKNGNMYAYYTDAYGNRRGKQVSSSSGVKRSYKSSNGGSNVEYVGKDGKLRRKNTKRNYKGDTRYWRKPTTNYFTK